jgi:hypothetical protein
MMIYPVDPSSPQQVSCFSSDRRPSGATKKPTILARTSRNNHGSAALLLRSLALGHSSRALYHPIDLLATHQFVQPIMVSVILFIATNAFDRACDSSDISSCSVPAVVGVAPLVLTSWVTLSASTEKRHMLNPDGLGSPTSDASWFEATRAAVTYSSNRFSVETIRGQLTVMMEAVPTRSGVPCCPDRLAGNGRMSTMFATKSTVPSLIENYSFYTGKAILPVRPARRLSRGANKKKARGACSLSCQSASIIAST